MKTYYNTSKVLLIIIWGLISGSGSLLSQSSYNICTGCGSNSYWPLYVGNYWGYEPQSFNAILSQANGVYVLSNNGTMDSAQILNGEMYFKWPDNAPYQFGSVTLTVQNAQWFKWIPSNPTPGQTWVSQAADNISVVATIVSTNIQVNNATCTYNNCLEISYNHIYTYEGMTATALWTNYYAMGVGLVYSTLSVNSATPTIFELTAVQLNGCGSTTGIDEVKPTEPIMNIYPNPANQYAEIKLSTTGNYEVSLLNILGQEIARAETMQTTSFETQQLPSGIYFVKVIDKTKNAELATRRFVVAH